MFGIDEYVKIMGQQVFLGPWSGAIPTLGAKQDYPLQTFPSYVLNIFEANPIAYACVDRRASLFAEARIKYRRLVAGRPGELFGLPSLSIFEEPWPNATTSDLLKIMLIDADLQGNGYIAERGNRLVRLRPDWVTLVLGVPREKPQSEMTGTDKSGFGNIDAEVIGYVYRAGGRGADYEKPVVLFPNEVAHFKPKPDPLNPYRGMSWITPVLRDIVSDKAASQHKQNYLEGGAVPSMVVKSPMEDPEKFRAFKEMFEEKHQGVENMFRTIFLGGGADATVVGSNMRQVDFKAIQGIGENRICVAAGVPGIVVGVAEGLAASTMNNVGEAKRYFGDLMRSEWRAACGALSTLVKVPGGAELWYDDRDIAFLKEDLKAEAEVQEKQAMTIAKLVEEGFTPESAVAFVASGDVTRLQHTGMVSVQLQPPGSTTQPSNNGKPPVATPTP